MVVKKAKNLTGAERRVCHSMSYRANGDISYWLHDAMRASRSDDVILYKEDGVILGWGIRRSNGAVGFWVRRSHRQQGIGTKLVERAKKIGKISTYPHDAASAKLFLKTNSCPDKKMWQNTISQIESRRTR